MIVKLSIYLVFGLALAAASPVRAQDAGQIGLARELMLAMHTADNFDAVIPTVMNALKPAITAGNAKAAKDWDDLMPVMTKEFSASKDSLIDDIVPIYAKNFSGDELRSFIAFYKSPAGEKLTRLMPVLAQQTMAAGQRFGQNVAVKIAERMKEELRKRGNNI